MAAVLHKMDESDTQPLLSQADNDIFTLGLKEDALNEEPTTVTDHDPVMATSKDKKDAMNGASLENTRVTCDDCENIETKDAIRFEVLLADFKTTVESDTQTEDDEADAPSLDWGDPMYVPNLRP